MVDYPYPVMYGESSLLCLSPEDSREFATLQLCIRTYLMHVPVQDSVRGSVNTRGRSMARQIWQSRAVVGLTRSERREMRVL